MKTVKRAYILIAAVAALIPFNTANAQKAFRHISAGIDISTAGPAIQVAVPVVSNHLVVKAGATIPTPVNLQYSNGFSLGQINKSIDDINSELQSAGLPDRIGTRFSDISVTETPKITPSKAMCLLEYYPFKKSSFHLVCGVYLGSAKIASVHGTVGDQFFTDYNNVLGEIDAINQKYNLDPSYTSKAIPSGFTGSLGERTFELNTTDKRSLDLALEAATVRPYFGLGFGRSIPKSRFGVQFDLGLWYHGTPALTSANEIDFDPEASKISDFDPSIIDKASFYPVASLKLILKIL